MSIYSENGVLHIDVKAYKTLEFCGIHPRDVTDYTMPLKRGETVEIITGPEMHIDNRILSQLKKHPNFWMPVKFPKVPNWLYEKYLKVREKNIYDDDAILGSISKEDIHRALLIMALRDIMLNDVTLTLQRVILHLRNEYDVNLTKGQVQAIIEDAKQLVIKVREKAVEA